MNDNEKNYLIVLKRIAEIAGLSVPELLNDTWQCHASFVDCMLPFAGNDLHIDLKPG